MKKKILFGCGKTGKEALTNYGSEMVYCFCDNNIREFEGKTVIDVYELQDIWKSYDVVLCLRNPQYVEEVSDQLKALGIDFILYDYEKQLKGSNKDVFSYIYKNNVWGTSEQDESPFFSGGGSHESNVIDPYISLLKSIIENNKIESVFEIGCGDFNIMNQVLETCTWPCKYTGMDVVDELVQFNREKYGNNRISFVSGDASSDTVILPNAELLIIRQVLQHLDNSCISSILSHLPEYRYALITEHVSDNKDIQYNIDKPVGEHIRLLMNSGVYIEHAPFNITNVVHLLSIPSGKGVIRTSLVIN